MILEIYRLFRRNLEWLMPSGVGAILLWKQSTISARFMSGSWDINSFYSAVFDWSSIQAAFLFSVFAYFLSRSEPFIEAVSDTKPFHELRRYVLRSLSLSILLSLASLPLLVSSPTFEANSHSDVGYIVFCIIAIFLSYTFMCFLKVVRVFNKLERTSL